jgi:hypothetical protein
MLFTLRTIYWCQTNGICIYAVTFYHNDIVIYVHIDSVIDVCVYRWEDIHTRHIIIYVFLF